MCMESTSHVIAERSAFSPTEIASTFLTSLLHLTLLLRTHLTYYSILPYRTYIKDSSTIFYDENSTRSISCQVVLLEPTRSLQAGTDYA